MNIFSGHFNTTKKGASRTTINTCVVCVCIRVCFAGTRGSIDLIMASEGRGRRNKEDEGGRGLAVVREMGWGICDPVEQNEDYRPIFENSRFPSHWKKSIFLPVQWYQIYFSSL